MDILHTVSPTYLSITFVMSALSNRYAQQTAESYATIGQQCLADIWSVE
jgi:hypothetical protein